MFGPPRSLAVRDSSVRNCLQHVNNAHEGVSSLLPGDGPDCIPIKRLCRTDMNTVLVSADYASYGLAFVGIPGSFVDTTSMVTMTASAASGVGAATPKTTITTFPTIAAHHTTGVASYGTQGRLAWRKITFTAIGSITSSTGFLVVRPGGITHGSTTYTNDDVAYVVGSANAGAHSVRIPVSQLLRGPVTIYQPNLGLASHNYSACRASANIDDIMETQGTGRDLMDTHVPLTIIPTGLDLSAGNVGITIEELVEVRDTMNADATSAEADNYSSVYTPFRQARPRADHSDAARAHRATGPPLSEQVTRVGEGVYHAVKGFVEDHPAISTAAVAALGLGPATSSLAATAPRLGGALALGDVAPLMLM